MCHMQLAPFPELNSTPPALVGHRESLPEELPHFLLLLVAAQVQVVPPGLLATELLPTCTHLLHLLQRTVEEGRTELAPEISPGATSSHLAPFRNVQLMLRPAMYAWPTNRRTSGRYTYIRTYAVQEQPTSKPVTQYNVCSWNTMYVMYVRVCVLLSLRTVLDFCVFSSLEGG